MDGGGAPFEIPVTERTWTMLNDVAARTRILEQQLSQAFAIMNQLPGQWEVDNLTQRVNNLTQRVNMAEAHILGLSNRVGMTHHHLHPQFKHNTPSAHLEGQVTEMKKAGPSVLSPEVVEAFMDEVMHA